MNDCDRRRYEKAKTAYEALMKFYPLTVENLDDEIWRPIEGYEDYQVSNFGRVKSFKQGKIIIRKPALNMQGYLYVILHKDGKQKPFRINRLVALAFIPNPDNKPEVNHKVGCKLNNYVGNLEWVTSSENQRHAFDNGLQKGIQGEEHVSAKLTNEQVEYVRDNPNNLTQKKLGEMFGVDKTTISEIQLGKTYKNAGGKIRGNIDNRIPNEIRAAIRSEYVKGKYGCGCYALAKKYGVNPKTILKIVHE